MNYTCEQCGVSFLSYKQNRKFCGKKCTASSQRRTKITSCAFCGKTLEYRRSRIDRSERSFCNRKCQHKWESTNKIVYKQLRDKDWCTRRYASKSLLGIAKELRCGETTVYKYFRIHNIPLDRKKWLINVPKTGKHRKSISETRIRNGIGMGDKNPNWKGGITRFLLRIRSLKEYREWKQRVMECNLPTCVLCGSKRRLEVDHIKQFRFIVSDNKITTIDEAKKCEELWNVDNGRIVCRYCNINREYSSNR